MKVDQVPLRVGAGAHYPWSEKLSKQFTIPSFFDPEEKIHLFRKDESDNTIVLPRRMAVPGAVDETDPGYFADFACTWKARSEEQTRVAAELTDKIKEQRSFILQAPTGFGKTLMGCVAMAAAGRRTLIITTKEDILGQWKDSCVNFLGLPPSKIGLWRGDFVPSVQHSVVIGLVHSIAKGPERYGEEAYKHFGLVICDEVHRMGANFFSQAMWWLPSKLRLGLSATPYRKDGRDVVFRSHIGEIEVEAVMEVMIPKVIFTKSGWRVPRNSSGEPIGHSPGKTMHLNRFFGRDLRRNMIICNFLKAALVKERSTIIFADTLDQLRAIQEVGVASGLPARAFGWYVGLSDYPTIERGTKNRGALVKLEREAAKRKPFILATYKMASEATDIPWLDAMVLAAPRSDVVQIVGRIRREYEGKRQPVVFDVVDDDSPVFKAYATKRAGWYQKLGCEVIWK